MTNTIDAETLREWLEAQRPVTVLDVRSDEDRAQWSIPGSVHINTYDALRAGQPGALVTAALPLERMNITRLLRTATVVGGIVTSAGLAAAQTPSAAPTATSETSDWGTIVYPVYGWAPIFGADVRLPEQPSAPGAGGGGGGGLTIPSASTSGNFNGAAFGGFRVERHRLAIDSTILWAGMSGSVDAPQFNLKLNTLSFRVVGGFEVLPALYIEGGARYFGLKMTAGILAFPEVTWKPGIWEPVIGVTFHPQLTPKIRLVAQADLGGIGNDSHRSSSAKATVEWKPINHLLVGAGWGTLYLRADGTILTKPVHLQQTLNGPILAIGIPF